MLDSVLDWLTLIVIAGAFAAACIGMGWALACHVKDAVMKTSGPAWKRLKEKP